MVDDKGVIMFNTVFLLLSSNFNIIIVNLATLVPGSGNPVISYSFLNLTIQFLVAPNMVIAMITIFLEAK